MIALLLLVALVVVVVGGRRLGLALRSASTLWRPTSGLLSVVTLVGAAVLAMREDWLVAIVMALVSGALALGARKRAAPKATATSPGTAAMSAADARAILGVAEGASSAAVDAAYRRLIRMAHPDHGGTTGLAAQLNAARAALR